MNQSDGQSSKVGHVVVQQFGSVVHFVVEASVADFLDVGVVGARDELF